MKENESHKNWIQKIHYKEEKYMEYVRKKTLKKNIMKGNESHKSWIQKFIIIFCQKFNI